MRKVLTTRSPLLALSMAIIATCGLWLAMRSWGRHALGTPGFAITISDKNGALVATKQAPILFTPEFTAGPPQGGSLTARASFIARSDGTYTWKLGATGRAVLLIDGKPVMSPRAGLVYDQEQPLVRGIHSLEVSVTNIDENGGAVLALKSPWSWGSSWELVGPDWVYDAPAQPIGRRLDQRLFRSIAPTEFATLMTLVLALVALLAAGRSRRQRLGAALFRLANESKLVVAMILLAIAAPMLRHLSDPGYYFCHEGESYTVRLIEYAHAIADGVPLGRWWGDPVAGRGYPFLCLYAPLLYLVATPFLLLGVSPLNTVKLVSAGLVLVGLGSTYGLAQRRASRPAAIVAALLFTYAPYLQTDFWIRADIAECLGFACFPLTLLALERALDADGREAGFDIAFLAIATAALGCCHNITAYFSVYLLLAWLLVRVAMRTVSVAGFKRVLWGSSLGFLMTVFYAVPAIGDARRVWIERVTTGYYHSLSNLVPIARVLTAQPRWGLRPFLGLAATFALIAAGVALGVAALRRRASPRLRTLAVSALVTTIVALLLSARPVGWFVIKYIPLASYVQFPWRMFLFSACTAPLAAPIAMEVFFVSERARWWAALIVAAVVVAVFAPQYGPSAPLVRVHINTEPFLRSITTDYVTSMNEYLPKTVTRTVPRFGDVVHVVAGSAALLAPDRSSGSYTVLAEVGVDAILEFNAHWFPGWRAFVDGAEQRIGPGQNGFDGGGLIRVHVNQGRHQVTLRYGRTRLRLWCDLISLAALLITLAAFLFAAIRRAKPPRGIQTK